jgi:hypothetical protein
MMPPYGQRRRSDFQPAADSGENLLLEQVGVPVLADRNRGHWIELDRAPRSLTARVGAGLAGVRAGLGAGRAEGDLQPVHRDHGGFPSLLRLADDGLALVVLPAWGFVSRPGGFGCASRRRVPSRLCSPGGKERRKKSSAQEPSYGPASPPHVPVVTDEHGRAP